MPLWPAAGSSWPASSPSSAACLPWTLAWQLQRWRAVLTGEIIRDRTEKSAGPSRRYSRSVHLCYSFDGQAISSSTSLTLLLRPCSRSPICSFLSLCWAQAQEPQSWVRLCLWGRVGFDGDRAIDPDSCRSVGVGREKVLAASLFCISISSERSGHLVCANSGGILPLAFFLAHFLSLCISAGRPTSLPPHPAIHPTLLCPFASRYLHSSFLFPWFFPSFLAPCDLSGVISRELNGEAGGCISVQSLNSSSTM